MSGIVDLLREDLREFGGYRSARSEAVDGSIWLNANESPWASAGDETARLRRYPEPQPQALLHALAGLYGCTEDQLLVGRGSDEAIDLLVRAFCTPGRDAVLVTPPVFGMYAVCARLQGARLLEVSLRDDEDDFHVDLDTVAQVALEQGAKLVFLCSPGNPAGAPLPGESVLKLAGKLAGRAIVVVDEAYVEFSETPSLASVAGRHANLAVLRTLSKVHALAAARVGCLIAAEETIAVVRRCQAPYPVPVPCAEQALLALQPRALLHTRSSVVAVRRERERLRAALADVPGVRRVYPAQGNFLLVRFTDAQSSYQQCLAAGIVVRDVRAFPQLGDALRITVGTPEQNAAVVSALSGIDVRSAAGRQR